MNWHIHFDQNIYAYRLWYKGEGPYMIDPITIEYQPTRIPKVNRKQ